MGATSATTWPTFEGGFWGPAGFEPWTGAGLKNGGKSWSRFGGKLNLAVGGLASCKQKCQLVVGFFVTSFAVVT